ncbi:MAG: hypothetical protein ACRDK0_03360 [Solirubrobacteraceae bacterium]
MLRRALESERGLAASEYAGVLAVVAGIFVALGLDGKVAETVRTAVCQITGGDCGEERAAAPEKCLTGSTTTSSNANVLIAVVQIDKDSTLIREDYSDGSSKFIILDNSEVAGELFAGVKGKIAKYGVNYSVSAEAGVGLEGGGRHGAARRRAGRRARAAGRLPLRRPARAARRLGADDAGRWRRDEPGDEAADRGRAGDDGLLNRVLIRGGPGRSRWSGPSRGSRSRPSPGGRGARRS